LADIIDFADIVIIGAGASGLMAACAASAGAPVVASVAASSVAANEATANRAVAAKEGAAAATGRLCVVMLERNERPGRKLSITGKGRCNITNNAEKEQFMLNIPGNGKFLFSAFDKMSNKDIVAFFERIGVGVALERGGRYFTKSGSAREVTDALTGVAKSRGVVIRCGERVLSVRLAGGIGSGEIGAKGDGEGGNSEIYCRSTDTRGDVEFGCWTTGTRGDGKEGDGEAGGRTASGIGGANVNGAYKFAITLKNNRVIRARAVILATGGIAYPATGSTGDGYKFT
jgi:predicted flavoprotein YhiN